MIRAGFHNQEILVAAQWSLSTVNTVREELETCEGKAQAVACQTQHRNRFDAVRSPDFVQELQKKVLEDPGKEIRSLVREKNVRLVTNEAVSCHWMNSSATPPTRGAKAQRLTARAQDDHLKKARKLLNKPKHPEEPGTLGFFSEKRTFCQDQLQITQNNRCLAFSPPEVPRVTKTRFPQTVMVFSCMSREDDVMPFHIVKEGLRLKSDGYVELLSTVVKALGGDGDSGTVIRVATGLGAVSNHREEPKVTAW